jgi:mRNA-degrading endonuclease RelE of RelBE toxin-antitoxin system
MRPRSRLARGHFFPQRPLCDLISASLTEELEGFLRLRVASRRVIFEYEMIDGVRTITSVFAGSRRWMYEVFQSRFME